MNSPIGIDERIKDLESQVQVLQIRGRPHDAVPLIEEIAALKAQKDGSTLTVAEHRALQAQLNRISKLCGEALNAHDYAAYDKHLAEHETIRRKLYPERKESLGQLLAGALRPRM